MRAKTTIQTNQFRNIIQYNIIIKKIRQLVKFLESQNSKNCQDKRITRRKKNETLIYIIFFD